MYGLQHAAHVLRQPPGSVELQRCVGPDAGVGAPSAASRRTAAIPCAMILLMKSYPVVV